MVKLDNTDTTKIAQHARQSTYDDNKDIIWPTVVGIFVALALGWMICRYKCSSTERSPHIVRCCPKSLCKRIRLCCIWIFRFKDESQQPRSSGYDLRLRLNTGRPSNNSITEIPCMTNSSTQGRSSIIQSTQQWPPPFLLNNNQGPSFPVSVSIPSAINSLQPQIHPLRRESLLIEAGQKDERRDSSPWPFPTTDMIFREQANDIKQSHLFLNA